VLRTYKLLFIISFLSLKMYRFYRIYLGVCLIFNC